MTLSSLDSLVESALERFQERFRRAPRWIVAAPGRVNLIGEHVDYNGGYVLPMAIDHYCVIVADGALGEFATVFSVATNDETAITLSATGYASAGSHHQTNTGEASGTRAYCHWSNYVAGVIVGCAEHGLRPGGFDAVIESAVPVGAGLSSSAAIEVATATLIEAMTGPSLDPIAKALLCQQAEHRFAGVPCGIMDQFASVLCRADHLMLLDCRSQKIEHIPFSDPSVTALIINSHVKHEHSGGEYAARRAQCESAARKLGVQSLRNATLTQLETHRNRLEDAEFRRARHAIGEIERTVAAAAAIKSRDWPRVGQLMYASHDSLRDDYEVSCRELDLLVELARDLGPVGGVFGSRMTGGGFGGCTVSLIETAKVDDIALHLAKNYRAETDLEPGVIVSRPARGAHVIRCE